MTTPGANYNGKTIADLLRQLNERDAVIDDMKVEMLELEAVVRIAYELRARMPPSWARRAEAELRKRGAR